MGCGGFKKTPNYTLGPEGFTEDEYEDYDDVYVIYPDQRLPIDMDMVPLAYSTDEEDDDEAFGVEPIYDDYSDLEPEDEDDPDYDPDLDYETEPEMDEVPQAMLVVQVASALLQQSSDMDVTSEDDSSASSPISVSGDDGDGPDEDL